jgi:hypothetical protein
MLTAGYRWAFIAASILAALGLLVALAVKHDDVKEQVEEYAPDRAPRSGEVTAH